MSGLVRLARALLRGALGASSSGDTILGDLEEEYLGARPGVRRDLRYVGNALRLAVGYGLWSRLRRRRLRVRARSRLHGGGLLRVPLRSRLHGGGLWLDVRQSARALVRRPTYLVAGVATLALGIGVGTAIWSVVWHSLLRRLPFEHADRVQMLFDRPLDRPGGRSNMNVATFLELRERSAAFDAMSAFEYSTFLVGGEGDPAQALGLRVNAGYFGLLGLPPRLGRDFLDEDDRPGAPRVVILSDGLWRERFGADAGIIGRAIRLNLEPHTVVGVASPDMVWPAAPRLWTPWAWDAATREDRRRRTIFAVGRIAQGIEPNVARA